MHQLNVFGNFIKKSSAFYSYSELQWTVFGISNITEIGFKVVRTSYLRFPIWITN